VNPEPQAANARMPWVFLRIGRQFLPSAATPIVAAAPDSTKQKQYHDNHEDDLKSIHMLLPLGEDQAGFGLKQNPFPFAHCYNSLPTLKRGEVRTKPPR
jgi:hypothetical protein